MCRGGTCRFRRMRLGLLGGSDPSAWEVREIRTRGGSDWAATVRKVGGSSRRKSATGNRPSCDREIKNLKELTASNAELKKNLNNGPIDTEAEEASARTYKARNLRPHRRFVAKKKKKVRRQWNRGGQGGGLCVQRKRQKRASGSDQGICDRLREKRKLSE